jgi:hypothetical protein
MDGNYPADDNKSANNNRTNDYSSSEERDDSAANRLREEFVGQGCENENGDEDNQDRNERRPIFDAWRGGAEGQEERAQRRQDRRNRIAAARGGDEDEPAEAPPQPRRFGRGRRGVDPQGEAPPPDEPEAPRGGKAKQEQIRDGSIKSFLVPSGYSPVASNVDIGTDERFTQYQNRGGATITFYDGGQKDVGGNPIVPPLSDQAAQTIRNILSKDLNQNPQSSRATLTDVEREALLDALPQGLFNNAGPIDHLNAVVQQIGGKNVIFLVSTFERPNPKTGEIENVKARTMLYLGETGLLGGKTSHPEYLQYAAPFDPSASIDQYAPGQDASWAATVAIKWKLGEKKP